MKATKDLTDFITVGNEDVLTNLDKKIESMMNKSPKKKKEEL